jgi:iron-sulfur cluster assembly protein
MIHLSQSAAKEIKRIQNSRQQPDSLFRIEVKRGGCCGLFYSFELQDPLKETNKDDRLYESKGINIISDEQSSSHLQGLRLDYSEDLMGGGFRFHNPNASTTCSCSQSFHVD